MDISSTVAAIIGRVKKDGDSALVYYSSKFDHVNLSAGQLKVPPGKIYSSGKQVDAPLRKALDLAASNIRAFHTQEMRHLARSWSIKKKGSFAGQSIRAIGSAGIYVPGGRFSYPSTVLMTAIPAKIAGVKRIVMVTPPKNVTPALMYAAHISGVEEIFMVGGAQAIAALAYGTKTIPAVDIIAGPGNAFVNEAKRQVLGIVGIDSLAGPSEVAIIAGRNAPAEYVIADLCAQAEHDPRAKAYLFSDSKDLISKVKKLLPQIFKHQVVMTNCSLTDSIKKINLIAPEHVELMVPQPEKIVSEITSAGAIFSGSFTPTAAGDYWAGPSHVLPTGGTARFSSGLSCATFMKRTSIIQYSAQALAKDAKHIEQIAAAEGLEYHRNSILLRKDKYEN